MKDPDDSFSTGDTDARLPYIPMAPFPSLLLQAPHFNTEE